MKRSFDLLPNSFILEYYSIKWTARGLFFSFTANNAADWPHEMDTKSKQINKAKAFFYRVISFWRYTNAEHKHNFAK